MCNASQKSSTHLRNRDALASSIEYNGMSVGVSESAELLFAPIGTVFITAAAASSVGKRFGFLHWRGTARECSRGSNGAGEVLSRAKNRSVMYLCMAEGADGQV